jgi:hypothetical protein
MEPARITVGGTTASKTGAYVRNDRDGFIAVVKAGAVSPLAVKPIEFLSRDLLKFNRDAVSKVELGFPKYTCTIAKEGGTWKFVAPVQGAAEVNNVNAILNDLSQLRGRRVVGRASDTTTFSLERPTLSVTLTVDNPPKPKPQPTTSSAPAGPPELEPQPPTVYSISMTRIGDKAFAMRAGGNVICEIDAKVIDDALAELLDTHVTPIEPSQARRLAYGGAEPFAFAKSGDDWKLVDEPSFAVDPAKVTEVFTTLNGLHAKEYARYAGAKAADFGLDAPAIRIAAETADGSPLTLLISSKGPEKGGRYACTAAIPDRVFVLKQEDVDKLAKTVQDFQKPA